MQTREQWLQSACTHLACDFTIAGAPVPEVRVSTGWPHRGGLARSRRKIGQCWSGRVASDGVSQIFVSPLLVDTNEVLGVLVHELVHATVGTEHGHRGPFVRLARTLGLRGKPTATVPGATLTDRFDEIVKVIGSYPHAALNPIALLDTRNTTGPKPQKSRWLKALCACGYTVRVTRQWAEQARPDCPLCKVGMEVDGL